VPNAPIYIEIVISPSENKTVELGPDSDVVA
jgi:hypothetical protein